MALPLAPLITGAAALVGSGLQTVGGAIANQKTIKANKELAEYSYRKDLEQWERQNQYNLPSSQMQRLRAAGLNPNLVYGSGNVAGITTSGGPKYNTPTANYSNVAPELGSAEILGMFQNFAKNKADIALTNAQTQSVEQRTANDALTNGIIALTAKKLGIDVGLMEELRPYTVTRQMEESRSATLKNVVTEKQALLQDALLKTEKLRQTGEMQRQLLQQEDIIFKKYENQLRSWGADSSSSPIFKTLIRGAESLGISFDDVMSMPKNLIEKLFK